MRKTKKPKVLRKGSLISASAPAGLSELIGDERALAIRLGRAKNATTQEALAKERINAISRLKPLLLKAEEILKEKGYNFEGRPAHEGYRQYYRQIAEDEIATRNLLKKLENAKKKK